jgi:hypothetical protein
MAKAEFVRRVLLRKLAKLTFRQALSAYDKISFPLRTQNLKFGAHHFRSQPDEIFDNRLLAADPAGLLRGC